MNFVAPLRRYFFPILDSVDRKKKDFCINLRHVMRSDVIRSNERIHGIIVLHHKIWQEFPLLSSENLIEIDNTFYMLTFLILSEIGYIIKDFKSNTKMCKSPPKLCLALPGRTGLGLAGKVIYDTMHSI